MLSTLDLNLCPPYGFALYNTYGNSTITTGEVNPAAPGPLAYMGQVQQDLIVATDKSDKTLFNVWIRPFYIFG